jgi:adsorption protein B
VHQLLGIFDPWAAAAMLPVAAWILLSGLDDLFVTFVWLLSFYRRRREDPSLEQLRTLPEKRIAVFVPLWHEAAVIAEMVKHNLTAIQYRSFTFFVGVYPNDKATVEAVRELETRHANVHLAMCPHDGPTSKADCLNWVYQRMLLYEEAHGVRFELIVPHDAEDLIHPLAFLWTNYYAERYDMVQIPVLPMPTPLHQLTHGLYCDEFAETQMKDLTVRELMGGFLPSSGVGTGFTRRALEQVADRDANRVFDPSCLTEDYENGFRLKQMNFRQTFAPLRFSHGAPVATREYFPREMRTAVKQRTRWITGIALQGWEKHGWQGGATQIYWHVRDRKGLLGNFVSGLANLLFFYGLFSFAASTWTGSEWALQRNLPVRALEFLLPLTLFCQSVQLGSRMYCTSRFFGWTFASGALIRAIHGNLINTLATAFALGHFAWAHWKKERISWLKTEHSYPTRAALVAHKTKLGEVLVMSQYCTREQLDLALATKPAGRRLGEHLMDMAAITEDELYEALSLQQSIPLASLDPDQMSPLIARSLPSHVISQFQVLPFKVASGSLFVAGPEVPQDGLHTALREFTRLEIRFELITRSNFDQMLLAIQA